MIASRGTDHGGLLFGFDSFRGYSHLHGARDGDAGKHHCPAAFVLARLDHKAAIELQLLEAELPEETDRGIAGTEIVERYFHAEAPDQRQTAFRDHGFEYEAGFGDLQLEAFGVEASFLEDVAELDREFRIAQLGGRNIDRQRNVVPGERIATCLAQNPKADRVDQPAFLGHWNEDVRADMFPVGAFPSQQAFHCHDPA